MSGAKNNELNQQAPLLTDFSLLICQVLKLCLHHRLNRLPSKPLVKLLYLSECEYYRRYRRRLTSLNWFFYKYGPWANELAEANPELIEREDKVIEANKCVKYFKLDWLSAKLHGDYIEDLEARTVVKHVVTPWAKRFAEEGANWQLVTRELLNEVYHHTAPMRYAKFGRPLDFTLISPAKLTIEIKLDPMHIAEVKKHFRLHKKHKSPKQSLYPLPELAPGLRDAIAAALNQLDEEELFVMRDFPIDVTDEDLRGAFDEE